MIVHENQNGPWLPVLSAMQFSEAFFWHSVCHLSLLGLWLLPSVGASVHIAVNLCKHEWSERLWPFVQRSLHLENNPKVSDLGKQCSTFEGNGQSLLPCDASHVV